MFSFCCFLLFKINVQNVKYFFVRSEMRFFLMLPQNPAIGLIRFGVGKIQENMGAILRSVKQLKNVQFAMILPPSPSSMSILKRGSSRLWGRMCDIDVEGAKSKKGNAIFETNFLSHIFLEFLVFVAIVGKISSSSSQSRRKNSKIH